MLFFHLQQFSSTFFSLWGSSLIKEKGEIQHLQYRGDHPSYHFSVIFSLTLLWDLHFLQVLGEIYWSTVVVSSPINT
jgi:hypothetical protein